MSDCSKPVTSSLNVAVKGIGVFWWRTGGRCDADAWPDNANVRDGDRNQPGVGDRALAVRDRVFEGIGGETGAIVLVRHRAIGIDGRGAMGRLLGDHDRRIIERAGDSSIVGGDVDGYGPIRRDRGGIVLGPRQNGVESLLVALDVGAFLNCDWKLPIGLVPAPASKNEPRLKRGPIEVDLIVARAGVDIGVVLTVALPNSTTSSPLPISTTASLFMDMR